mmetsp:Transcript_23905/g.60851  ORF Transcript_23905/g.60851 Transcript_23905/m.60851 type:complete len:95 (-) Transcript_23905:288-572(-)
MDLNQQFELAQAAMKTFNGLADKDKLRLYALYKQAVNGPAKPSERPSAFQVVSRAKWDSWAKLEKMDANVAKQEYVKVAEELKPGLRAAAVGGS